jgi:threonine dehydrogenase-like Zn-dependent dehydrogenase
MMHAVVWHGGPDLRFEAADEPAPAPGQVVFDVALAGVCGSDLHAVRGHHGPRKPPLILGHELVGTVAGRSGRFVPFPLVTCRECAACRRGEENLCDVRGLLGLDRPGAFAERVAVAEDSLVAVPDGLDDRLAVLVEPLATPLSALHSDVMRDVSSLLVVGCGPIGLLAIHAARQRGLEVIAVEPVASRRALAPAFGAREVHEQLSDVADLGVDAVIDAVGVEATVQGAVRAVRRGGNVAIVGLGQEVGQLPIADLVRRGVGLWGHYAYTRADFEEAMRMLAAAPLDLGWLDVADLDSGPPAIHELIEHPERSAKVLLRVGTT